MQDCGDHLPPLRTSEDGKDGEGWQRRGFRTERKAAETRKPRAIRGRERESRKAETHRRIPTRGGRWERSGEVSASREKRAREEGNQVKKRRDDTLSIR
jgi:hypothetical protein